MSIAIFWVVVLTSDLDISGLMDDRRVNQLTTIVSHAAASVLKFDPATAPRRTKHDRSPVSAADEAANAIIIEGLSHLFPNMRIVSEETAVPPRTSTAPPSYFALVDPLDGTKEFLASRDKFTVNVALVVDGAPIVGVISAPAIALVWRGVVGRRAERFNLPPGADVSEAKNKTFLRTQRCSARGLVAAISRSHFDPATAALLSKLRIAEEKSCGSSIKFCRIAEGSVDIYPRLAPTHEWDVAAGHAIVAAAGGTVIAPDGRPLAYGGVNKEFIVPWLHRDG